MFPLVILAYILAGSYTEGKKVFQFSYQTISWFFQVDHTVLCIATVILRSFLFQILTWLHLTYHGGQAALKRNLPVLYAYFHQYLSLFQNFRWRESIISRKVLYVLRVGFDLGSPYLQVREVRLLLTVTT